MFRFVLGGCGTGKSTALMQAMKQDLLDGKDVIVIVPEQFSFDAEKRIYEALQSKLFNRLKTYSFFTLSQKILYQYGNQNQSYASEQEKLMFLYQAVKQCEQRGELQILYKNSTPDSLLRLQELVTKLRKEGITAEKLRETAPAFASTSVQLHHKTQDIACILSAYDQILQEYDLGDSLNDLTSAVRFARQHDVFAGKHVYVDEFGSFSGDQYQMLETIMEQAAQFQIAIRTDKPDTRQTGIFNNGNQTYLQLRRMAGEVSTEEIQVQFCEEYQRSQHADLKAVASQILRLQTKPAEYQNHVHIFEADDPAAEIEYICATIYHLLAENPSLHCRDIAIAVKQPDTYRPLLERALARYALPYDIAAKKPVLHTELIRYFLVLTEILSTSGWRTETLLRYLKNDFSGYDSETVAMMEHFCFTWSIDKDDWNTPFFSPEDEEISARSAPFGGQTLEEIRCALISRLQALRKQCSDGNVRKICRVLYEHLCQKKDEYDTRFQSLDILQQKEFITLWNMLSGMLDTIVQNLGEQILSFKELYPLFLILLKNSSFSTPPETLDSIRIVETLYEILTVRLNAPAVVFVTGATDRAFPAEIQNHGIFSEQELRHLEQYHIRVSHLLPELYSDELLIINKILAAPSEQLYLTYPLVNGEHQLTEPSVIAGEILRMFPEASGILKKQKDISLTYYAWTKAAAYFHFVRNLHKDNPELASLRKLLEQDEVYAGKIRKLTETAEPDRRTSPEVMRTLLGDKLVLSPSGIEAFYQCPFSYFCNYCLHLYMPERVQLSAQNIGNFAHYCLERILSRYKQDFIHLTEEQLRQEVRRLAQEFKIANFSASVRNDGRFQLNYEMNCRNIVQILVHMQEELRKTQFTPIGYEVALDEKSGLSPLLIPEKNILCRGKIDRVDICNAATEQQTYLRVVDYKTGTKFLSPQKLIDGLDMQMLIYLLALEQNHAYGETSAGGVMYLPSGQPEKRHYDDRNEKIRDKAEILHDFYQMKGLILENAVPYMESDLNGIRPILQAAQKDTLFSVNQAQFATLEQHVIKKISEMGERLYAGDTAPKPYLYQSHSPCETCPCADICGHATDETLKKNAGQQKEALNQLFGGDSDETKNDDGEDE